MLTGTQMANSSTEFNEPDFPEYDSTPYGGGYDISTTYGKPLLPSHKICYPRDGETWNGHSETQQNGSIPPFNPGDFRVGRDFETFIESNSGDGSPQFEYNYTPNGHDFPIEENGYSDYGRQVPPPPSEYVEPCASLFGYWPCLLKEYQKNAAQQCCSGQGYGNEWKRTEEYFFGSSYPYGEAKDDNVRQVDFNYGYEQHYVEQPTYVQEEQLWSQKMSYSYYES